MSVQLAMLPSIFEYISFDPAGAHIVVDER